MASPKPASTSKAIILRTFAEVVAERGYSEASFREVADELSISKGTIVHHYGTKERLLEAVHREYMTRRLAEANVILGTVTGAANRLTAVIAQLLVTQRDDRASTIAFAREITRFSSLDLMKDVRGMRAEFTALLRSVIWDGMQTGEFRRSNVDLITLQVFGMCNWSWTWWRTGQEWTVADVVGVWSQSILDGLEERSIAETRVNVAAIVEVVEKIVQEQAAA